MTDDYPSETTWDMVHVATGELVGSGGPYADQRTLYQEEVCLDDDPTGCYVFTIHDSYGDGISQPPGYYNVFDPDGALVCSGGGDFGSEESCYFGDCTGACCVSIDCIGDYGHDECADIGGDWYIGETCDEFACPFFLDCEDALYHNGYPAGGNLYPSQCDPAYPFQYAAADDFVLPGPGLFDVYSIAVWIDHSGSEPPATPDDYEALTVTIFNDADGVPAGHPIDGSPECDVEGDYVFHEQLLPGDFYYLREADTWFLSLWFFELRLYAGRTYWLVIEPVLQSDVHGHTGVVPADRQTGSLPKLYAPQLGYDDWETPETWTSDISFCMDGYRPFGYIAGDCNHNFVPLELADVITMIATYRGTIESPWTLPCPPHGADFPPAADPNGNCVANELADVVTEILAYRGQGGADGCPDCPPLRIDDCHGKRRGSQAK